MLEAVVYDPLISWRLLDDFGSSSNDNEQSNLSLSVDEEKSGDHFNSIPSIGYRLNNRNGKMLLNTNEYREDGVSGRSYAETQAMVQEPIRENMDEDGVDADEIASEGGSFYITSKTIETKEGRLSAKHPHSEGDRKTDVDSIQPSQKQSQIRGL